MNWAVKNGSKTSIETAQVWEFGKWSVVNLLELFAVFIYLPVYVCIDMYKKLYISELELLDSCKLPSVRSSVGFSPTKSGFWGADEVATSRRLRSETKWSSAFKRTQSASCC